MAIYVFNLLVGYFPCGVDNAQAYRAQILDRIGDPVRYIFTEIPAAQDIEYYRGIGIPVREMLSAHQYFTDNHSLEATEKIDTKLHELKESLKYTNVRYTSDGIELLKDWDIVAAISFDKEHKDCLRSIMYFKQARLIRNEFYTSELSYAEYYVTVTANGREHAKLVRRTYFNKDGAVGYDMIYDDGEERYLFPDGRCYTKSEFMAEFIKRLNLSRKDVVIIDRFSQWKYVQPLFQFGNTARFIAVLHSGHYYEKNEGPAHLLYLNEEYFYLFKYTRFIDTIVVSTEEQKEELREKLTEYEQQIPKIAVIPAGGIQRLRYPETKRKPYSLIAVSRLARSKRVHEIIRSVIRAHQENSEISLDIYGSGEYEQELRKIVEENDAQHYILFAGYKDVTEVYRNYEVFLTASFHETLGLSTMEAVASGVALIGLNVKYGNRLFIHPEKNGYLIDIDLKDVENADQRISDMAKKVVEIFRDKKRLEEFHEYSYRLGENFLFHEIEEKWVSMLTLE